MLHVYASRSRLIRKNYVDIIEKPIKYWRTKDHINTINT